VIIAIPSIQRASSGWALSHWLLRRISQVIFATVCWAGLAVAADSVPQDQVPLHETVRIKKSIGVGAAKAWTAIRGIGGLDRWFPVIATCRVEGAGVGATRILTLKPDGAEMHDKILEISDDAMRLRYERVKSPFPIAKYLGTVNVISEDPSHSTVSWNVDIDVTPAHREEMVKLLTKAISDGVDGLEKELR